LKCGTNNCPKGIKFNKYSDCCYDSKPKATQAPKANTTSKPAKSCDGLSSYHTDCCSASNQCDVGEGDCDSDNDCKGSLKCGTNNCPKGIKFNKYSDCCYDSTKSCDGLSSYYTDCCSASNQCGLGEGDCDSDNDCKGSLKCGANNCLKGRKFNKYSDCCYDSIKRG